MLNHVWKPFKFFFFNHQCQVFVEFKSSLNPSCCGLNVQLLWFTGKTEPSLDLKGVFGLHLSFLFSRFSRNSFFLSRPKPPMTDVTRTLRAQ